MHPDEFGNLQKGEHVRKEINVSKVIRQSVTFEATPHEIYEMLMDSRKHAKFTGERASISRKVGGKIMASDGYITGTNLELDPDKKIVQAWHASDWPADHVSRVTFCLVAVKHGTRLIFTHRGVPDEYHESIKQGWIDYYWIPMKAQLARK
jgi:activator of HSP90 ATPase